MFDKFKMKFKDKKIQNLISMLIILVITLIIINRILKEDKSDIENQITNNVQMVNSDEEPKEKDLEIKLENILSNISGVGNVQVLLTYSQTSTINPIYNETSNQSTTEENMDSENKKTTQTQSISKEIVTDNSSNPIIQTTLYPKIEGAIILATGAANSEIKADIISAVEAVTGLATHKIQVFEMK